MYIELGKMLEIKIRCIYVATSIEESMTRNNLREKCSSKNCILYV